MIKWMNFGIFTNFTDNGYFRENFYKSGKNPGIPGKNPGIPSKMGNFWGFSLLSKGPPSTESVPVLKAVTNTSDYMVYPWFKVILLIISENLCLFE